MTILLDHSGVYLLPLNIVSRYQLNGVSNFPQTMDLNVVHNLMMYLVCTPLRIRDGLLGGVGNSEVLSVSLCNLDTFMLPSVTGIISLMLSRQAYPLRTVGFWATPAGSTIPLQIVSRRRKGPRIITLCSFLICSTHFTPRTKAPKSLFQV